MPENLSESNSGTEGSTPKVVVWFKVYAAVLCVLYLLVAAASFPLLTFDPAELEMSPVEAKVMGVMFLIMGVVLFVACLLPFFLRPRPWVWVYNLVIICFGLTSACFLIACVPLLIFWLKPEVKAYYGKD